MKTLILMRHGAAESYALRGGDAARVLTAEGEAEARAMGAWLRDLGPTPSCVLASNAARAQRTAELAFGHAEVEPRIYEASSALLIDLTRAAMPSATTLVMVGHQPGIGDAASALVGGARFNVATGCAIGIGFAVESWQEVRPGKGWLLWMLSPAMLPASAGEGT